MADGICTLLDGDISQCLGDARTCKAGAQQVILVLSAELQGGEDVVLDEILLQVQHVQLGSAGGLCLFFQAVQLSALTHVTGNSNDLAVVVVFLQPGNDDGGVQTAGVSQNDFFDVFLFHDKRAPLIKIHFCSLMRISLRILCLSFAVDAFIIRRAAFASMLKTDKPYRDLIVLLVQFASLCSLF